MPDAQMNATTVAGKLTVKVSADAGYLHEINTFNGSVHTCFGGQNGNAPLSGQVGPNGPGRESGLLIGAPRASAPVPACTHGFTFLRRHRLPFLPPRSPMTQTMSPKPAKEQSA